MRTNKARLGVERLDTREVPACIVTLPTPDTVAIVGDNANDTVIINDNGAGIIFGAATGFGGFAAAGIKNVRVNTGSGSDQVTYNLIQNLLPGQVRTVNVQLGTGYDRFTANLFNPNTGVGSDLMRASQLTIVADGGDGGDWLRINAQHQVDVALGAALNMILYGEAGNDVITGYYQGHNYGKVSIRDFAGGAGEDTIRGIIREVPGSTGVSSGQVRGDDGNDNLSLYMWTQNPPSFAVLDGGAGIDLATGTANVMKVNVP